MACYHLTARTASVGGQSHIHLAHDSYSGALLLLPSAAVFGGSMPPSSTDASASRAPAASASVPCRRLPSGRPSASSKGPGSSAARFFLPKMRGSRNSRSGMSSRMGTGKTTPAICSQQQSGAHKRALHTLVTSTAGSAASAPSAQRLPAAAATFAASQFCQARFQPSAHQNPCLPTLCTAVARALQTDSSCQRRAAGELLTGIQVMP